MGLFLMRYSRFQVQLWRCQSSFMEAQLLHIVGKISPSALCLGPRNTDGSDEQTDAAFLLAKDLLDQRAGP